MWGIGGEHTLLNNVCSLTIPQVPKWLTGMSMPLSRTPGLPLQAVLSALTEETGTDLSEKSLSEMSELRNELPPSFLPVLTSS